MVLKIDIASCCRCVLGEGEMGLEGLEDLGRFSLVFVISRRGPLLGGQIGAKHRNA